MTGTLLRILAGVLLGSLATWVWLRDAPRSVAPQVAPRSAPASVAPQEGEERGGAQHGSTQALSEIEERLSNIEALLLRTPAPGASRVSDVSDRDTGDLEARLDALLTLLESGASGPLAAERGSSGEEERAAALQVAMEEQLEPNWTALDELLSLWYVDEERARMQVQLLSFAAVVERFGRPNLTWGGGNEIVWVYGRDYYPDEERYRIQVMLYFVQGVVAKFYVEEN